MKKQSKRPSIEKFRIAKLNRPDYIIGGGGGDDGTIGTDDDSKCEMKSIIKT